MFSNAIRGMHDILPKDMRMYNLIVNKARIITSRYGFEEISTPIVEEKDLFCRTLGEDSDVVSKQLYAWNSDSFEDNSNAPKPMLALRPEGTAGVMRSVLSPSPKSYYNETAPPHASSHKYFYHGPMFRFERPQKGRYRQFEQVGVEWIEKDQQGTINDAMILSMADQFLTSLNIKYILKINSLGDNEERLAYRQLLQEYFGKYQSDLSETSRQRLLRGSVLRILDSKDMADRTIIQYAPKLCDSLRDESKQRFDSLLESIDHLGIPYEVDHYLVRGLDYYNHTIFECIENDPKCSNLGAQNTILAGGRYDDLAKTMGSKSNFFSIGWAAGIDRLGLIVDKSLIRAELPTVYIILLRSESSEINAKIEKIALKLMHDLSSQLPIRIVYGGSGSAKKQFSAANKLNAHYSLIIGETEAQHEQITLKDMTSTMQSVIPLGMVFPTLSANLCSNNK